MIGQRFTSLTTMVLPFSKRVPPKSFVRSLAAKTREAFVPETRKDSAVHASLSSSSLVKQPGAVNPYSQHREFRKDPPDGKYQPMAYRLLIHSSK